MTELEDRWIDKHAMPARHMGRFRRFKKVDVRGFLVNADETAEPSASERC